MFAYHEPFKRHLLYRKTCKKTQRWKKPSKYFHSENWSYLKLTKESFILVLHIIFGREGSRIFPLAPCIAFPSCLGGDYVAVSPLHTTQLWSGLALMLNLVWPFQQTHLLADILPPHWIFWLGCGNLQYKDKYKRNSLYFFIIEIVNI